MARERYKYLEPGAVAKISNLSLVARTVVEGSVSGLHKSPFHGFSVEFSEHREYTPGDNIKDIDWRALGRTDRFYIKRYQEETNLKAYLLLDTSASMAYKSEDSAQSKLEYASYVAACLAYLMIRQRDSVGLVTFSDQIDQFIPPRGTAPHLNLMMRQLEAVKPVKRTNVSRTFHDLAENIKRRGLIIIFSDLFDDPAEVMKGLHHFRFKKHEVILFHLFDPWELAFPFRKLADFIDMETDERLQVDPRYVRDEYCGMVQDFIRDYKRQCSASRIEYVQAETSQPYELALTQFLSRRTAIARTGTGRG